MKHFLGLKINRNLTVVFLHQKRDLFYLDGILKSYSVVLMLLTVKCVVKIGMWGGGRCFAYVCTTFETAVYKMRNM
jgi:hypothetical protein